MTQECCPMPGNLRTGFGALGLIRMAEEAEASRLT